MKKTLLAVAAMLFVAGMANGQKTTTFMKVKLTDGNEVKYKVADVSEITLEEDEEPDYESVDLGLSVKWASMNLGAKVPEDAGTYYAWGELYPWYLKIEGSSLTMIRDYGGHDRETYVAKSNMKCVYENLTGSNAQYDVAAQTLGGNWRLPTKADVEELLSNTFITFDEEVNGVKCVKLTSTKSGYTDKYILIPYAGYCNKLKVLSKGDYGYCWTSDSYNEMECWAYAMKFIRTLHSGLPDSSCRFNGLPVRPVCDKVTTR